MKIENGRIARCTDAELFQYWIMHSYDDIMDYYSFKRECIACGTEIIEEGEE